MKKGRHARTGQRVQFLFMRSKPGVCAWNLGDLVRHNEIYLTKYLGLLERATTTALQLLRVD
jgi:hypothetical protein